MIYSFDATTELAWHRRRCLRCFSWPIWLMNWRFVSPQAAKDGPSDYQKGLLKKTFCFLKVQSFTLDLSLHHTGNSTWIISRRRLRPNFQSASLGRRFRWRETEGILGEADFHFVGFGSLTGIQKVPCYGDLLGKRWKSRVWWLG